MHCLIPFKIVCQKVRGLLWPIARKKDLISLRSAALVAIFVYNLVDDNKCQNNFKTA